MDLLDPKNDFVFKRLFTADVALTAALINDLRPGRPPVISLRILNPTILPEELTGKCIVLDVLAECSDGHPYNIEMQVDRARLGAVVQGMGGRTTDV